MEEKINNKYIVVLETDKIKKILQIVGEQALIKKAECIELKINLVN